MVEVESSGVVVSDRVLSCSCRARVSTSGSRSSDGHPTVLTEVIKHSNACMYIVYKLSYHLRIIFKPSRVYRRNPI